MTDEAELLQRLRKREKNSIDEAIRIYTPYLSTVLYHMAGNSLPKEDIEEIVEDYTALITEMAARNPELKWLFTVSPIRHIRDGMHANQLSKSTLLLAIDRLQQLFPERVFYFPSYEIILDELRDYRFYADDMLHPSPLAIRYLWERFSETFFSPETKQVIVAVQDIRRDLAHKPFHPESEAYQRFLGQIVLKIERLIGKYPYLDFQKETELCHMRLNP